MGRTACWHKKLQDYNFKILHVPGKNNTPADALSRPCDDKREVGEWQLSLLPESTFLNLAITGDLDLLETMLVTAQRDYRPWLKARRDLQWWTNHQGEWLDANQKAIVPPDQSLYRCIMHTYHDGLGVHPGRDEMVRKVLDRFAWPGGRQWIDQYVRGCTTCQQNKNLMHRIRVPPYKITVPQSTLPFSQVAMDLVTGLPKS